MPQAYVGTSGFRYKEWKPDFYPEDVPEKGFLQYYATRLRSVEIDGTFYRMPSPKTLDNWRDSTPPGFRFAVKASRRITHFQRIKVPSEALDYLVELLPRLEDRLGLCFFQLPPFLRFEAERFRTFLEALPAELPRAFEFRHPSWFCDEVYDLLRAHEAGLCIHEADEFCTPMEVTADIVYVRLRRSRYSDAELGRWAEQMRGWVGEGRDVFAYIKHEENPDAPQLALALEEKVLAG